MHRALALLIVGCVAGCPLGVRAEPTNVPVIGYLDAAEPASSAPLVAAFRSGLAETGYREGHNVGIEFRWGNNDNDRLPELAADLVARKVAVIVVPISTVAALVAKAATTSIPILFSTGADPMRVGLVASLSRPGGNISGVNFMNVELSGKRLEILNELLPQAARFAVLVNPKNPASTRFYAEVQGAASALGRQVEGFDAIADGEIDAAFAALADKRVDALLISTDASFHSRRDRLVALATQHRVPAIYPVREFVESGGLISYGPSFADAHHQLGVYAGRILAGAKPSDLPVIRPTKFELVINRKTAKTLGLTIPYSLLGFADEVVD